MPRHGVKKVPVASSSGNIFSDLGFPPKEAEPLRLRAQLMSAVRQIIEQRNWMQEEAAIFLSVTQPRINDVTQGKIDLFSIDILVSMLARASVRVQLIVEGTRISTAFWHGTDD